MVYSTDGFTGMEAVVAHQLLSLLLSNKLKREYLEMCGFVRARTSLAIVISNTLLLHGAREKEVYIQQRLNLEDGAVMSLLAPWRGYAPQRLGSRRLEVWAEGSGLDNKRWRRKEMSRSGATMSV